MLLRQVSAISMRSPSGVGTALRESHRMVAGGCSVQLMTGLMLQRAHLARDSGSASLLAPRRFSDQRFRQLTILLMFLLSLGVLLG